MKVNALQLYDSKGWSGITTDNHLSAIGAKNPQIISNAVEYLYPISGPYNPGGEDIFSILNKFPVQYIDDADLSYQWYLADREDRSIPLISWGDSTLTAVDFPGKAGSSFYMKFAEDYFGPQTVIGSDKKETYQLQIVGDAITSDASGAVYEVRLFTGDNQNFIPASELYTNSRWVEMYTPVEYTMSKRGGKLHHSSPFKMENDLSMIRLETVIPGNMIDQGKNAPLAFAWKDPQTGKTQTSWLGKMEWDYLKQFRMNRTNIVYYGKSTKKNDGTFALKGESGYSIRTGFGLYDQIAPSNIHYYDAYSFDIDYFIDVIMGMTVGKFPEDMRRIVIMTGSWGARLIHEGIIAKAGSIGQMSSTTNGYIRSNNQIQASGGKLTFTSGQYIKYIDMLGIELEVIVDPMKDDLVMNTMDMPDGKGKVNSRIMDIWDFGTDKGKPNIQLVKPKGTMQTGLYRYVPGLRCPYTTSNSWESLTPSMAATKIDGYELIRMDQIGAKIHNPVRCARFIPNFLR